MRWLNRWFDLLWVVGWIVIYLTFLWAIFRMLGWL